MMRGLELVGWLGGLITAATIGTVGAGFYGWTAPFTLLVSISVGLGIFMSGFIANEAGIKASTE